MRKNQAVLVFVVFLGLVSSPAFSKNGFELGNASIPAAEIHHGGPPRDGIPAIDNPRFVSAGEAEFLSAESRVLGVEFDGQARAYPIAILNWHEIVNDGFGGHSVLVTYCPLCGNGMVFKLRGEGQFGVSGLLYNSNVLLYDRATESLWSQLKMEAISGERRGERLALLPASHTSWADWRRRHPQTRVLSTATGFERNYRENPYREYDRQRRLYFPVSNRDKRYHPKEMIIGVNHGGLVKAWPFTELAQTGGRLKDTLGDRSVTVIFDAEARTGRVLDSNGVEVPSILAYWFAWMSFHPQGEVYQFQ